MIVSDHVALGRCSNPKCGCIHVFLYDRADDKKLVAVGAIRREFHAECIKALQDIAYEIATEVKT